MLRILAASLITLAAATTARAFPIEGSEGNTLEAETIAIFERPWAMSFLPNGSMLVTQKGGQLVHVTADGTKTEVGNMFGVEVGGQGGLGDVVADPGFAANSLIWMSYVESLDNGATRGATVVSAVLDMRDGKPALTDITKIWTQEPHLPGKGHFSHRIAFGPKSGPHEGKIFITSGDRQKQTPAQDMEVNLGKVIRLNLDGSIPADNPFAGQGGVKEQFWTTGHRNPLGIDFDSDGQVWAHEMGPRHGDELNLLVKGDNYGWPIVSNGNNYSGVPIPNHDTMPEFNPPEAFWVPAISPAGFVIYDGDAFADWKGDGFIGGLSSRALIRVDMTSDSAEEAERYSWDTRVREVEQGSGGALYVLEDGEDGRLLRLTPGG